ncbi:PBSX family phage terminase large subunit [Spirosoma oryzicola]|uniref:PBSX family phage terminase large subunit n=1 Tax=Spirosoma oryzicola TaxID=2898794 RepID=UPI001E4706D6|nr:PBSX family phage terminase large subunit [Spirosoma oryzicola]UHG91750.1 PBSX family phage terminase large subunit [Spirosoma oryzicola]
MSRPRKREAPLPPRSDHPERSASGLPKKVKVGKKMYEQVRPNPIIDMSQMRHKLLPVYQKLVKAATDYTINYGGGGSGKSFAQAQYFVRRLLTKKHKLLVIRKFGTSLNDSVIAQFKEVALPFFGLRENVHWKYNGSRKQITFANGSTIIFKGLDDAEKFKSIVGVSLVWIEEATEIEKNEFKIVNDRIRGKKKVQIFLTYNPISERHWLRERFHNPDDPHKGIDDRTTVIFSTYLENPFVGQKYIDEMAYYQDHDPDHYRVYGLGQFGIIRPENPYFTSWKPTKQKGKTKYNPAHPVCVSFDFNIKNSFVVSQHYDGKRIQFLEAKHGEGDLLEMCRYLAIKYGRNHIRFTGDASGNAGSAYTTGNVSAWTLIEQYMAQFGATFCDYEMVPKSNPSTASSRHICNALLVYYMERMTVDLVECGILTDDIERMRATSEGSLDKHDANKNNYGHIGDCFRYALHNFEYDTYLSLGIAKKGIA